MNNDLFSSYVYVCFRTYMLTSVRFRFKVAFDRTVFALPGNKGSLI